MSKEKTLEVMLVVLTAMVMVTKAIQASSVLDCTDEYED